MKDDGYRVLLSGGSGEITEKKSRFIATLKPVHSEEEAVLFIEEMKKKYWDARHNCFAYVIGNEPQNVRCSDDGEPAGTAGRPMLEVLQGEEIKDVAVVVTRYFGGVLLGTGGLVRAYTQAVKEGLLACETGIMRYGTRLLVKAEYTEAGKIQYLLSTEGVLIEKTKYADDVEFILLFAKKREQEIVEKLTQATCGRAKISVKERLYFVDKEESC